MTYPTWKLANKENEHVIRCLGGNIRNLEYFGSVPIVNWTFGRKWVSAET